MEINAADKIIELLNSTARENIDKVIDWMKSNGFFEAPASSNYHNNFRFGLVKHSFEVYEEAIKLNEQANLPKDSVIICSLLHDICKSDQYGVSANGEAIRIPDKIEKGHGKRSVYILKHECKMPLNYDEEMAIWWHMGEYEKSKKDFEKKYQDSKNLKLCKLIRSADAIASGKKMKL